MWLFVLPLAVVILDQFSKYIVVENMALGESIPIIEEVFHLTYILECSPITACFLLPLP